MEKRNYEFNLMPSLRQTSFIKLLSLTKKYKLHGNENFKYQLFRNYFLLTILKFLKLFKNIINAILFHSNLDSR